MNRHIGKNIEELEAEAAILGAEAFKAGLGSASALNPLTRPLLYRAATLQGTLRVLTAYAAAWHKANIDAPVPGWSAEENAALRRARL